MKDLELLIFGIILIILMVFSIKKPLTLFLTLLQIVSFCGIFLLNLNIEIKSIEHLGLWLISLIMLLLVILPWRKYGKITIIANDINPIKLKRITKYLIIINTFVFVFLLITTIIVQTTIKDINQFKYEGDLSTEFFYKHLPFNVKFFILSTFLYGFSYFLLPLHFFYASQSNYGLSTICLVLSLNIILYGSTFFSRSVIIQYIFLYTAMFLMLKGSLPDHLRAKISKYTFIGIAIFLLIFINITRNRFENDNLYSQNIHSNALVKDPVTYSYIDYLSQWHSNSLKVLERYNFKNGNGRITFNQILSLLPSYNAKDYFNLRYKLMGENWYTFIGFPAYMIVDFGIFVGTFLCIIYLIIVENKKPVGGIVKLNDLFIIVLLVQIPLMSIFYSQLNNLIFPFLFLLLLQLYIKIRTHANYNL